MTSPILEHTYDDQCRACGGTGWYVVDGRYVQPPPIQCQSQPIILGPRYKDLCPHEQEDLTEVMRVTCEPGTVTVCTACGQSFPGQLKSDLLVA